MKQVFLLLATSISLNLSGQISLTIKVIGIEEVKGEVQICPFDKEEDYMKNAIRCEWIAVKKKELSHSFLSVPEGKYAIVVIQDLNGNRDLDTNFIGMPKEPYGFSTNPSTTFGPPSFDGASLSIEENSSIEIKLK